MSHAPRLPDVPAAHTLPLAAARTDPALEVPEVPVPLSQTKRIEQAASTAREAIALVLETDETNIAVEVLPVLADNITKHLDPSRSAGSG